jgi:RNA polymerase sigma factor (TIGR02999 family)
MSDEAVSQEVTRLLQTVGAPDRAAADQLLALVYDQLRKIAQQRMSEERAGHTLEATALVHEAYLRLVGDQPVAWSSRAHFFFAAGRAMQQILVEHARARRRAKRGGGIVQRVPLSVVDLASQADSEEILALDEAVCRLETEEPDAAAVVRLRFYAGLNGDDCATALSVSPRQVDRLWAYARAWLYRALEHGAGTRPSSNECDESSSGPRNLC